MNSIWFICWAWTINPLFAIWLILVDYFVLWNSLLRLIVVKGLLIGKIRKYGDMYDNLDSFNQKGTFWESMAFQNCRAINLNLWISWFIFLTADYGTKCNKQEWNHITLLRIFYITLRFFFAFTSYNSTASK